MNKAKWDNKGIIDGKCMPAEEWGSMDVMTLWLDISAVDAQDGISRLYNQEWDIVISTAT